MNGSAESHLGDFHAVGLALEGSVRARTGEADNSPEPVAFGGTGPVANVIPGASQPREHCLLFAHDFVEPSPHQISRIGGDPIRRDLVRYRNRRGGQPRLDGPGAQLTDPVTSPARVRAVLVRNACMRCDPRRSSGHGDSHRFDDAGDPSRLQLGCRGAITELARGVLLAPARDATVIMHGAHTALPHRDCDDILESSDGDRVRALCGGPAIDPSGNRDSTRAVTADGDRSDRRKTDHLHGFERVGTDRPTTQAPAPQCSGGVNDAV